MRSLDSTSSSAFHCFPFYTFVQIHSLKLVTHICLDLKGLSLSCPVHIEHETWACLTVWSRGLCWREITLCLQIRKRAFSFLITSSLSPTHYVSSPALSLSICPYIWVLNNSLMVVLMSFTFPLSLFLPFIRLRIFLALLINVLLGCVTRELKAQGDFVKDKIKTIVLLHSSYLIYPWTIVDVSQASICFNY